MNFKALNMNKGLKRIWIIGSVFWFVYAVIICCGSLGLWIEAPFQVVKAVFSGLLFVGLWWAVFYLGIWVIRGSVFLSRWVARGFKDDDDKKAGF